jgi:hypothetical protein
LAQAIGLGMSALLHGLRDYRGEPHRVQSIAISDGGEYIELLNLLLRRKITLAQHEQAFIYQFHVSKSIKNPLLNISLESVNSKACTDLKLDCIEIKRVKL